MGKYTEKWKRDYTGDVNLEDIEWTVLTSQELNEFLLKNYVDKDVYPSRYVCNEDENNSGLLFGPHFFGMEYLSFDSISNREGLIPFTNADYKFLIGAVDNNSGRKTIVASTKYADQYFTDFEEQKHPVTLISNMEVNSYFRGRGIFTEMCGVLSGCISMAQHIITSMESDMGSTCHVLDILRRTMESGGFENHILTEEDMRDDYYRIRDIICSRPKVPKSKNYPQSK